MNVARGLERRLERLLEGVLGRVFTGRIHPSEIATRIAREADLARFDHASGPATANSFTLTFNPRDLEESTNDLSDELAHGFADYVRESGLRLVGPPTVALRIDEAVLAGQFHCHLEVAPGPQKEWARLSAGGENYVITPNRAIVGRSPDADVTIPYDDVSRQHCLIWRSEGTTWVKDLGSANGTRVDDTPVGAEPAPVESAARIEISSHEFRFVEASNA